jgi:DNA invertase Pin-like site-specific DNA recombinase
VFENLSRGSKRCPVGSASTSQSPKGSRPRQRFDGHSPGSLGRSTVDLLTTIKAISDKGCQFKSLTEPWADTTTPAGRLMLTILGGLAEFERELIKVRTREGRARAIKAGIRMGRKPILSPYQIAEIRNRKAAGESVRMLARSYRVSPNTISRVR